MKSALLALCTPILCTNSALAQLPNDECANAAPIPTLGSFPFSTIGATDSTSPAGCNSSNFSADVWYEWTSGAAGNYQFSICGGTFEAVLALYNQCGESAAACATHGGCVNLFFDVDFDVYGLPANTTYLLQVDGWGAEQGTGTIDVTYLGGLDPVGFSHCPSSPNSTGNQADLVALGTSNVALGYLELHASDLPAGVPGLFFYGSSVNQIPSLFGDGVLCVQGPKQRLPILMADANGSMTELDFFAHPMPVLPILAGAGFTFQCWYRDPAAMDSGFNLSRSLLIHFY